MNGWEKATETRNIQDLKDLMTAVFPLDGTNGGEAGTKIATSCIPVYRCGTNAPAWMSGTHPTVAEGKVTRKVCYSWAGNCCYSSSNIEVVNCGGQYYVYKLNPTGCSCRYCGSNNWWKLFLQHIMISPEIALLDCILPWIWSNRRQLSDKSSGVPREGTVRNTSPSVISIIDFEIF